MENNNFKRKKKKIYAITICTILLLLIGVTTIGILSLGKSNLVSKIASKTVNKEAVKLKHTNSTTTKSSGVYITDVSDVVDEAMSSIVAITSKTIVNSGNYGPFFGGDNSYTAEGAGSGVIVAENDNEIFILTNYHVVEDSTELTVTFIDEKSIDATIKGVSERKDIAVVSVNKKDLSNDTLNNIKIATIGNSNDLKVGDGIIAIGNALGYGQSVTTGVVSALNREVSTDSYVQDMIQIDAAINGGNSGGALLNSKGEVVGINSVKYSSSGSQSSASIEGMGFAIPISDVEELIEKLISGNNDDSAATLGIEGYMTTSMGMSANLPEGFYVSKIEENSNAAKSELEIGNIITEIDGNEVTSIDTIKKVLNKKQKGDKITLKVKYPNRNQYKEKEISINLN